MRPRTVVSETAITAPQPLVGETAITAPRPHRCRDYERCYHISQTDLEVLLLASRGLTTAQIAFRRHCHHTTIRKRFSTLFRLFEVESRMALVVLAHQLRIITIAQMKTPPPVIVTRYSRAADRSLREA